MRERHVIDNANSTILGITPAYAGKTLRGTAATAEGRDHPRVCGKDYKCDLVLTAEPGSPPRMRERRLDRQ